VKLSLHHEDSRHEAAAAARPEERASEAPLTVDSVVALARALRFASAEVVMARRIARAA
jgi:hypothetical protein